MAIYSVDPGDNTGIAVWSEGGVCINKYELNENQAVQFFLTTKDAEVFIIEDWRLDRWRAEQQRQSRMVASQIIGMCRLRARQLGALLIVQDRQILQITALHMGIDIPKSKHLPNDISALLHGFRYFIDRGVGIDDLRNWNGLEPVDDLH